MTGFWQRPWIRYTSLILVLALMTGIFLFSSQGKKSETTSESFAFIIIDTVHPEYNDLSAEAQIDIWQTAQRIVRKAAHIFEYALLGFLICVCLESWFGPDKRKKHKWLAFAIGAFYAASDEIHQYFIPGRSCEVIDVLIDSLGVLLGVMIAAKIIKSFPHEKDDDVMEPWSKKTLTRSLLLAVLFGALLTVCLQLGLSYIRPNSAGSISKHLMIFTIMTVLMISAVLLCAYTRPIRKLWDNISKHILNPETRKPILDIIYTILAVAMLLHHFYVILYYPAIPAGATRLAPIWLILAVLTILMGRTWRDKGFLITSFILIFAFERCYLKNLTVSGETAVYFFSAIYSMFFAAGVFFVVKKQYRIPLLQSWCILWSLGILALCGAGLYFAWTGNKIVNFAGAETNAYLSRLNIFAGSTITGGITGTGALIALIGFAISKHKAVKGLYLLVAFIAILTTSLTDSRSSFIFIAFMLAGTICIGIWGFWRKHITNPAILRIILMTVCLLACFCLCFWGAINGQKALSKAFVEIRDQGTLIPAAQAEESDPPPSPTSTPPGFQHRDILISNNEADLNRTLTGRYTIWQNAFSYLQKNPNALLFGLSVDGSVAPTLNREDHLHNLYIQTLMEGGIPALLLYFSILIYFFYHTCRLWKHWHLPLWQRMLPLPVLSVFLLEMAECLSHFSYGHPPMTIFWFFLGCTVAVSKTIREQEKTSVEEKAIGG